MAAKNEPARRRGRGRARDAAAARREARLQVEAQASPAPVPRGRVPTAEEHIDARETPLVACAPPPRRAPGARERPRVAIACQGGGSQTAFTAGALRGLLANGAAEDFEVVSISGTSGGAICALLAWYALQRREPEPWRRLYEFWRDNAATTPLERAFNEWAVGSLRLASAGWLPSVATSPSAPLVRAMTRLWTRRLRPHYADLGALLARHVDFAELARWGVRETAPVLVVGAANVLSGRLARFSSLREPIRVEHLLASAAVPNLFPAVEIDGGAYWDGLFSDNPPVSELAQPSYVGERNLPEELWVVKINPTRTAAVPVAPETIGTRRNELVGNVSLFQQIDALTRINELLLRGAFAPEFARRFEVTGPLRLPKCFDEDEARPYHIPFIEMSPELQAGLDYESKLDRSREHIERLMADGERQAAAFLAGRRAALRSRAGVVH